MILEDKKEKLFRYYAKWIRWHNWHNQQISDDTLKYGLRIAKRSFWVILIITFVGSLAEDLYFGHADVIRTILLLIVSVLLGILWVMMVIFFYPTTHYPISQEIKKAMPKIKASINKYLHKNS